MGFFRRKAAAPPPSDRLDWRLLQQGAVALYYKPQVLARDVAWFRSAGYRVFELDAAAWSTAADFHAAAKQAFAFPQHYTNTLASWLDALSELDVPDDGGAIIVLSRYDAFARAQRDLAQTILDSVETTSRRFMLTGRRLLALAQSDDPRIRFERVGAVPVTWNPREWVDAERIAGAQPSSDAFASER